MKICIALIALLLQVSLSFDFYILRHGARAPLAAPLQAIFGVNQKQLTAAGRSQAYYLGQELKKRHPLIEDGQMLVGSTKRNRTKQTAEFFLKGWYGLIDSSEPNQFEFKANPDFLPPCKLSFKPKITVARVKWFEYESKVSQLQEKYKPPIRERWTTAEQQTQKRLNSSKLCKKVEKMVPKICQIGNRYFFVSDLITCLQFERKSVPNFTKEEIELVHSGTDLSEAYKYRPFVPTTENTYLILNRLEDHYIKGQRKLVLEFCHDGNLLEMLRALLGFEEFRRVIRPHIIIDFLSMIRFRVRDRIVKLFFNDKEIPLKRCFKKGNAVCRIDTFLRMIDQKLF